MRSSGGSGVGRFSHGHTSSAGSTADWGSGSGNWSPSSAGQPLVIVPGFEKSNVLLSAVSLVQLAAVGSGNVFAYSLLLTLCLHQCCFCCCIAAMSLCLLLRMMPHCDTLFSLKVEVSHLLPSHILDLGHFLQLALLLFSLLQSHIMSIGMFSGLRYARMGVSVA